MSKCCWKNGAHRLARSHRVATNLQTAKNTASVKHNQVRCNKMRCACNLIETSRPPTEGGTIVIPILQRRHHDRGSHAVKHEGMARPALHIAVVTFQAKATVFWGPMGGGHFGSPEAQRKVRGLFGDVCT